MVDIKTALRTLWLDMCTIYEYQPVKRENRPTIHEEVAIIVDEPCKLSFAGLSSVNQTDAGAEIVQTAKLFIDEELNIKAGSKIVIKRKDKEFIYGCSGEAGIFTNHQEIALKSWKGWA